MDTFIYLDQNALSDLRIRKREKQNDKSAERLYFALSEEGNGLSLVYLATHLNEIRQSCGSIMTFCSGKNERHHEYVHAAYPRRTTPESARHTGIELKRFCARTGAPNKSVAGWSGKKGSLSVMSGSTCMSIRTSATAVSFTNICAARSRVGSATQAMTVVDR
jgi:hypothetical protein